MAEHVNRRAFLSSAVATGAFTIVPGYVLAVRGQTPPSERITLAQIGTGTQGINEIGGLLERSDVQIVAVCDPNRSSDNYVEWGKHSIRNRIRRYLDKPSWRKGQDGCPGGREIGREIVDTWYANNRPGKRFNGCRAYADFRELLAEEKDVDAVKIMTPDHLHATISIAAMKQGKHVLMHKPIANRLAEGRLVLKTARQTGRATHLLAYGVGPRNALIAERVKQGVIGQLREIHNWSNRPVWPQYTDIPKEKPPVPEGFNWDLWLGPARYRPYHPHYTHAVFRGWYDFGGGAMADMGIYSLWPVFTALDLGSPVSARAWKTHTCAVVDNVSRRKKNDFSYPTACSIRFKFPARQKKPAVELFWYDGGMKPRFPEEIEAHDVEMGKEGIMFVGDQGAILAGFMGQRPRLFVNGKQTPLELNRNSDGGRHSSWFEACKGGDPSPGNFLNAAAITDTVNLGTIALRTGEKVLFDSEQMRITNVSRANKYLTRDYREGWEL